MNIKTRTSIMVLLPLAGMAVVIAAIIVVLGSLTAKLDTSIVGMVTPIRDKGLRPLVEEAEAVSRILLARREAFQTVVAEKAILSARSDAERSASKAAHAESVAAVTTYLNSALSGIDDDRVRELGTIATAQLEVWRQASTQVLVHAQQAAARELAHGLSLPGGSAHQAFGDLQRGLEDLEEFLLERTGNRIRDSLLLLNTAEQDSRSAIGSARKARDWFVIAVLVVGLIGTALSWQLARNLVRRLGDISGRIASQGGTLERRATELASGSRATAERAGIISSASEQMSQSITSVATASEQMSASITTVASSAATMTNLVEAFVTDVASIDSGIAEAADEAGRGSQVVSDAAETAHRTSAAMQRLAEMASEIGHVSGIIFKIAEQTNLLALNATIEAASAGDAGRGFAVVANEIKELAGQSGKAAADINARIAQIQSSTKDTNAAMQGLTGVMNALDHSSITIAARMDQQRATIASLRERIGSVTRAVEVTTIAINEINTGAEHVSRNAGELTVGATEVARGVTDVSAVAVQSQVLAEDVRRSFEDLLVIADELRRLAGRDH